MFIFSVKLQHFVLSEYTYVWYSGDSGNVQLFRHLSTHLQTNPPTLIKSYLQTFYLTHELTNDLCMYFLCPVVTDDGGSSITSTSKNGGPAVVSIHGRVVSSDKRIGQDQGELLPHNSNIMAVTSINCFYLSPLQVLGPLSWQFYQYYMDLTIQERFESGSCDASTPSIHLTFPLYKSWFPQIFDLNLQAIAGLFWACAALLGHWLLHMSK